MGAISCTECNALVDKKIGFCPFCGNRMDDKTSLGKKGLFSFFLGTLIILFLVFMIPDKPSDQTTTLVLHKQKAVAGWQETDHSASAYTMTSIYVRERLKLSGSAKFPTLLEGQGDHVTNLGKQQYHVVSYVDTEDESGGMLRYLFQGEIKQIKENEWHLISLDMQRAKEEVALSLKASSPKGHP